MDDLENKFYEILESHNHEIAMDFVWLVNLAHELAEAAQQSVKANGTTLCEHGKGHCQCENTRCRNYCD